MCGYLLFKLKLLERCLTGYGSYERCLVGDTSTAEGIAATKIRFVGFCAPLADCLEANPNLGYLLAQCLARDQILRYSIF